MKIASSETCTACMACIDSCPHQVLGVNVDKYGYFKIEVQNEAACIDCGLCTKSCPVLTPPVKNTEISKPYAVWDTNMERRKSSASGGAFAALAALILQRGGVVYGAAIQGFDIVHKRITDIRDLSSLQGSKYQASNLQGIYKQVRKDLRSGNLVLFSGLSCQIAGLKSYLGKTKTDNLFTVDTICGGISTMLPMLQLKATGKYKGIKSFRDKELGWQSKGFKYALKMVRQDDSIENLGLDNLVLNTFSSKLFKRESCLNCQFTGFHRLSDCTIADFWGDEKYKEQHPNGVSVLIIHSDRFKSIVEDSDLKLNPIHWKEIIGSNHNLYWTRQPMIKFLPTRKKALTALLNNQEGIAMEQIRTNSIPGLILRTYLKMNTLYRNILFHNTIKNLD